MNPIFAWLNGWEVVAILAVVLIIFGAKKLPELAKGLGQGIKEFKKSSREIQDEILALRILRGDFLERVETPERALASARNWS